MNIVAENLGYYELGRIARFIEELNKGNPIFSDMLSEFDEVTITYCTCCDNIYVIFEKREEKCIKQITLTPEDMDIEY